MTTVKPLVLLSMLFFFANLLVPVFANDPAKAAAREEVRRPARVIMESGCNICTAICPGLKLTTKGIFYRGEEVVIDQKLAQAIIEGLVSGNLSYPSGAS